MKVKYSGKQLGKYAQFAADSYSWKFLEKPAIERHLKHLLNNDTRVLDAGCGTGRTIKLLLHLGIQEKNLTGADISSEALNIARKFFPNLKLIRTNLPNLKLKNNSLDLVLSNMTFHYLNQKDFNRTIKNISKWLVNGGYLYYVVVHPLRFISNYKEYFVNKVKEEKTPWGTKIEYYPKKLSDYISTTINTNFDLVAVEEPTPVGKAAKKNKVEYKKYSTFPTRLLVKAVKKK